MLQEVDLLYATAMDHFRDSALLHVFIAQYLRVYRGNRHLELLHIAAAEVRECVLVLARVSSPVLPVVDVAVLAYLLL